MLLGNSRDVSAQLTLRGAVYRIANARYRALYEDSAGYAHASPAHEPEKSSEIFIRYRVVLEAERSSVIAFRDTA